MPTQTHATAWTILIAGALATVALDLFGQGLAPLLGYPRFAPVPLAQQALEGLLRDVPAGAADTLHILTGLVVYPLGYLLVARPISRRTMPRLPWIATAVAYGAVLWAFTLYVVPLLVAGSPAFRGFTGIAWVALWGHILFAVVAAWAIERRPRG